MISLARLQLKREILAVDPSTISGPEELEVEGVVAHLPRRLSDQHCPVELALDVCVAWPAGMDKRVDGNQDKALRV